MDVDKAMWAEHKQVMAERIDGPNIIFHEVEAYENLAEVLQNSHHLTISACKFGIEQDDPDSVGECPATEADFYAVFVVSSNGEKLGIGDAPTLFAACCMAKAYGDLANLEVRVELMPEHPVKAGELPPHAIEIK
ncbi:hypothetical protein EBZ39_16235 [bacterium]|nr:hypothetical protein [bacterium]